MRPLWALAACFVFTYTLQSDDVVQPSYVCSPGTSYLVRCRIGAGNLTSKCFYDIYPGEKNVLEDRDKRSFPVFVSFHPNPGDAAASYDGKKTVGKISSEVKFRECTPAPF